MPSPLLTAGALPALAAIGLAMGIVYAIGRRTTAVSPAVLLRLLAVAGFVVPGWTVFRWYDGLVRARDALPGLAVETQPVVERFVVSSSALLTAGFALLVAGIYLARRLPGDRAATADRG